MPDVQRVEIDLHALGEIARTGVRRAAVFMGLGLNAAHRTDFVDYELTKLPVANNEASFPVNFVKPNASAETIESFKSEFATWITGCGFRELLEYYALFLDHIHKFGLLVFQTSGKIERIGDPEKLQETFNKRLGIPDKLDVLNKRFDISPQFPLYISAFYRARNSLTHDLGVVSEKHFDESGRLALNWHAVELIAEGAKSKIRRPLRELFGTKTDEETTVGVKYVEREKLFNRGDKLHLSDQDLWEILFFFYSDCIPTIMKSFKCFLKAHNISFDHDETSDR